MVLEQSVTGRPRERAKAQAKATLPHICAMCDFPIDMTADPHRDPLACTVDEIIPRSRGGSAIDPANLQLLHRHCNTSRHNHALVPWDPGWPTRTHEPEELRERCRTNITRILTSRRPIIRTW